MHNFVAMQQQQTFHPQQRPLNSNHLNSHHQSQSKVLLPYWFPEGYFSLRPLSWVLPKENLRQHEKISFFVIIILQLSGEMKRKEWGKWWGFYHFPLFRFFFRFFFISVEITLSSIRMEALNPFYVVSFSPYTFVLRLRWI